MKKVLSFSLFAALALVFMLQGCGDSQTTTENEQQSVETDAVPTEDIIMEEIVIPEGEIGVLKLPNGEAIEVFGGSMDEKLFRYLNIGEGDGTFTFDRVSFSGDQGEITEESFWQIGNVGQIIKAFSKRQFIVTTHSFDASDEAGNQTRSEQYIERTRTKFEEWGADISRIQFEAKGATTPDNNGDQKSRIELQVIQ